jgi:hypothetical protein
VEEKKTWTGGPHAGKLSSMIKNEWDPNMLRFSKANADVWKPCGWHMSYFMSAVEVSNKIMSFSHSEYNKQPFIDVSYITQKMKAGEDLFGRDGEELLRASPSSEFLPLTVTNNRDYYRHFLEIA